MKEKNLTQEELLTLQEKLIQAIQDNDKSTIEKLIVNNKDIINFQGESGETILHYTAANGHTEIAQLLLDNGADVNIAYNGGNTPLHYAVHSNNKDTINLLLDNGADINKAGTIGNTPLYWAACKGNTEIVKLLLEAGADINKANNNGSNPLSLILSNNELLTWFKEQFTKDSLGTYNNIGKLELLKALFYIKSHEELQTNDKIIEIANITRGEVAKLGIIEVIKGAFEDIKNNINSLNLDNHTDRVKILSKIKLVHDLIDQANDSKGLKYIINSKEFNIVETINSIKEDIKEDIKHKIKHAENDLILNLFDYMHLCKDSNNSGDLNKLPNELLLEVFSYLSKDKANKDNDELLLGQKYIDIDNIKTELSQLCDYKEEMEIDTIGNNTIEDFHA